MDSQLTDTLRAVLSDPESMKSIMKIAQSMKNDSAVGTKDEPTGSVSAEQNGEPVLSETEKSPSETAVLPKTSDNGTESSVADNRVKLLLSLRPFLDPSRREKVDDLIKALGAAQVLYQLGGSELFKSFGL